jgi:hypothetical protein
VVKLYWTFKFTYNLYQLLHSSRSRDSSVSVVSGYGLDDRAIEVWSPAEAKKFSFNLVSPDRLWAPPSLLYNGYGGGGLLPWGKARPGRDAYHSALSAEVVNEWELFFLSPCLSWFMVQTKLDVSEMMSWLFNQLLTYNVCFSSLGLSFNVESL